MKLKKHVPSCLVGLLLAVVVVVADQFNENTDNIVNDLARDRSSAAVSAAGPWFSRILGLIGSKDFKGLYQKYIDNERDEEAADTATGVLARRNLSPGPVRQVFVTEPRNKHHHHHHRRHHHHHNTKVKKWVNVKIINQVGTRVKLKADKILPSAVLSSGEIFVYHELLNGTDRRGNINLQAVDEYTDQPLLLNGETRFTVLPVSYDRTQEAYVTREDSRNGILDARHGHVLQNIGAGNRWFYVKLINNAAGRVRVTPDQILPSTTLDVDESQVEYARLEPGDEYKRIVLRAVDVRNDEPVKLNGEFTLALRPDDAGDVTKVKITRGDTIFATCDNFVPMEGEGNFEFQVSTDETKSWFDSVRACKLCNAELLSVHSREENDFVTRELRKASEVHKLWIGMSYKEKVRMWSWTDGSRYRYQNWKEGQHYDGKDEQCGIIYQQYDWGRWDDDNCYKPLGYVCKRHRTKSADSVKSKKSGLAKDKRGCPTVVPDCPSLCSVIKVPGSCPRCDCGSLVKGYGSMSHREREKVRRLFSEANRQMAGLRRAQIEEARAARRSMIMRQAGRLMAESRHLQQLAMMEGIPLSLPFTHSSLRRQEILSPTPDTTESSTKNLAREIVGLIDDIEKTSEDEKKAK